MPRWPAPSRGAGSAVYSRPAAGSIGASLLVVAHPATQRRRPHVGPGFVDICQTLVLISGEAVAAPAGRQLALGRPDRVLLLVVDDDDVHPGLLRFRPQPLPSADRQ